MPTSDGRHFSFSNFPQHYPQQAGCRMVHTGFAPGGRLRGLLGAFWKNLHFANALFGTSKVVLQQCDSTIKPFSVELGFPKSA